MRESVLTCKLKLWSYSKSEQRLKTREKCVPPDTCVEFCLLVSHAPNYLHSYNMLIENQRECDDILRPRHKRDAQPKLGFAELSIKDDGDDGCVDMNCNANCYQFFWFIRLFMRARVPLNVLNIPVRKSILPLSITLI